MPKILLSVYIKQRTNFFKLNICIQYLNKKKFYVKNWVGFKFNGFIFK